MRTVVALAAFLLLGGTSGAQTAPTLRQAYARVATIVNFATVYVGESLLACASAGALSDSEAEERFQSYRQRNAALVARTEAWSRETEVKLRGRDEERAAREDAREAGLSAVAGASLHAQREVGAAPDARAFCATRIAAIDAGAFDLARNAELRALLEP
jgi:hypothetical protein